MGKKLNDIFKIPKKNLKNYKIKLNMETSETNPIDILLDDEEALNRWMAWKYKYDELSRPYVIGLVRETYIGKEYWNFLGIYEVLEHFEDITDDVGYKLREISKYRKYKGELLIKYKNSGQNNIRNAESLIDEITVEKNYILLKEEIINNIDDINITETEREVLAKTRIGHSEYKAKLLESDKKCRVCNLKDGNYLIASHIKPWSVSSDKEKLDQNNGLLLCPNHDYLFDRNRISFDENGFILISASIDKNTRILLNLDNNMKIELKNEEKPYMNYHRQVFYQKEKEG